MNLRKTWTGAKISNEAVKIINIKTKNKSENFKGRGMKISF
ncbi:hypothetical protein OFR41_06495 [Brachyspira hyodysenteriae]|nr:hypothetical protein [Brachyspira hyodysenteriae]MCZ9886486.1 hypothetical protein [Brachyspira hyodysenteriae]MCZ9924967.1 hypothetical protein [Brachyspira hyodysenteriae]MDA0034768.1 hypothetical protein [Brachyspira hyodysenteriae]MDA0048843.1 hypothetical protein [Brachyspira hyodysenteriae]MDA0065102.1 hypothetical protein [Brachyspira hyodysenteriae]